MFLDDGNAFNRFTNLDGATYRIVNYLAGRETKHAENLWKILSYDTEDCLMRDDPTRQQRLGLLYTNNGDASTKRVFMSPYIDDAWDYQTSHLHVYIHSIAPQNHISSTVNIGFECIVHNKISNIIGDANILNPVSNPSEFGEDGDIIVRYKSRAEVMLKSVLAELNGQFIAGVGTLQFNSKLSEEDKSKMSLWNNRKFFGYSIVMSTLMSGASADSNCSY